MAGSRRKATPVARDTRPFITDPDGNKVYLDQLPLVAFRLACGHVSRDYGVQKSDLYFCETCKDSARVTEVLNG